MNQDTHHGDAETRRIGGSQNVPEPVILPPTNGRRENLELPLASPVEAVRAFTLDPPLERSLASLGISAAGSDFSLP